MTIVYSVTANEVMVTIVNFRSDYFNLATRNTWFSSLTNTVLLGVIQVNELSEFYLARFVYSRILKQLLKFLSYNICNFVHVADFIIITIQIYKEEIENNTYHRAYLDFQFRGWIFGFSPGFCFNSHIRHFNENIIHLQV